MVYIYIYIITLLSSHYLYLLLSHIIIHIIPLLSHYLYLILGLLRFQPGHRCQIADRRQSVWMLRSQDAIHRLQTALVPPLCLAVASLAGHHSRQVVDGSQGVGMVLSWWFFCEKKHSETHQKCRKVCHKLL